MARRTRSQQRLQPRGDARAPGFGRFERNQALFELSRRSPRYTAKVF
jgi:hypothetical protein